MISFSLSTFKDGDAILTIRKREGDKRIEKTYSTMEGDDMPMLTQASLGRIISLLKLKPTNSTYTSVPNKGNFYIYWEYKDRKQLLG